MEKTARLYHCVRCHCQVIICRACDRGNIYCHQGCAALARHQSVRAAGKRYQSSYRGKQQHAERQRRYRARQNNKVTHQGSQQTEVISNCSTAETGTTGCDKRVFLPTHCHFCGHAVEKFLRYDTLNRCRPRQCDVLPPFAQAP